MNAQDVLLLSGLIALAAFLYSSVGHAGASGYLAAMALLGMAPAVMKPTALVLNILVATIGTVQFGRAGHFSWNLFWPFAAASIPAAFIGGSLEVSAEWYKRILGLTLIFGGARLLQFGAARDCIQDLRPVPIPVALCAGAAIGCVAGMIGVGGGIFLSPLLLMMGWATTRQTAAVSVAFILVNSIAGLLGHVSSLQSVPAATPWLALAACAGGLLGSHCGSRRFEPVTLRRLLAVVLVVAGVKMLWV